jgi:hypothetical protein
MNTDRPVAEPEDALMEARRARHGKDAGAEAYFLGYASGLTEAYRGARWDPLLRLERDDYARGYSAAYRTVKEREEVGSRALRGVGRAAGRPAVFADGRPRRKSRKARTSRRPSKKTRRSRR